MSNKYLVKISGLIGNVVKPVFGVAKDVVKSVAKDVGHSAHTALGGGYRDAAVAKGIKNQKDLRAIKDPKSYLKATKPRGDVAGKGARKDEINRLQSEKKKAIVKTVGYGAAGAYGGNKILNKIKGNDQPQYY